jgi:hypothetical protein
MQCRTSDSVSTAAEKELEMTRVSLVGLCVICAIALSAVAAAGASAQAPEYGRCEKAEKVGKEYKGKFSSSSCTKEVPEAERAKKGKYEWHPGTIRPKQTSSGGKGILEEVEKYAVGCESESSTGEYTGTKEGKDIVVKFKGCHSTPLTCTSAGHEKGELETKPLAGRLIWENEKTKKAAIDLFPEKGELFIEFNCEGKLSVAVKGSVLVPVKADKMGETFTLKFKAKHGFQVPEYYEEGGVKVKDVLLSDFAEKGYDQAGQSETVTVKNEEKLEVNTVV